MVRQTLLHWGYELNQQDYGERQLEGSFTIAELAVRVRQYSADNGLY